MKTGRTLTALAEEIERQRDAKRDFVADTRQLSVVLPEAADLPGDRRDVMLAVDGQDTFPITHHALRQIGERIKIPAKYVDRMREEAPELLATNVNHWFAKQPERRMVRTMDRTARAFLSDRYRMLDHADLMEAVLPVLQDLSSNGDKVDIASCEVTDSRLYLKVTLPFITRNLPMAPGHGHHILDKAAGELCLSPAIIVTNSEVGMGSLQVTSGVFDHGCTNLAVRSFSQIRKYHVGRAFGGDGDPYEIMADDTRKASDHALWLAVRDVTRACADPRLFDEECARIQAAGEKRIEQDPVKAVEVLAKRHTLSEDERGSVLTHLIQRGDLSQWGVSCALTRTAADVASYDRATELEALGGRFIDLPEKEWRQVACKN